SRHARIRCRTRSLPGRRRRVCLNKPHPWHRSSPPTEKLQPYCCRLHGQRCNSPIVRACAMRTDSRLVQMFVAVADTLSFTRGAETLHVAQPWLSSQIRKLEAQLGFDLFIRDSRRVALTEQGKALRDPAHAVMLSLDEFSACAGMLRTHTVRALLRIGLPPYSHLFARRVALLARFAQLQPKLEIEIVL